MYLYPHLLWLLTPFRMTEYEAPKSRSPMSRERFLELPSHFTFEYLSSTEEKDRESKIADTWYR